MPSPSYLDQISTILDTNFPDKWWDKFEFEKDADKMSNKDNSIAEFIKLREKIQSDIFEALNLSILTGEYLENKNFVKDLKKVQSSIIELPQNFFPPDEGIQKIIRDEFQGILIEILNLCITDFLDAVSDIHRKIDISSKQVLLWLPSDDWESSVEIPAETQKLYRLFRANLYVMHFDHFLNTHELYKELNNLYKDLEKTLNIRPYSYLIRSKCGFLLSKILLRKKKESAKSDVYYVRNTVAEPLNIDEWIEPFLKPEIDYIYSHYELQDAREWQNKITNDFELIKDFEITNSQLTARNLHRLIKYYKDVNPNIKLLKTVREAIEVRLQEAKNQQSKLDIHSYSICLNYAINNEFSLACADTKATIESINEYYSTVIDIQTKTHIKNFFPQYKYVGFLIEKLQSSIKNKTLLESLPKQREICDICSDVLTKYKDNIEWTKRNYNFVFQLPFSECQFEVNNEDAPIPKLYIFSSFMLPLPEEKYTEEYEYYKLEIKAIQSSIGMVESINSELKSIKETASTVRDREFRMIEVLGIFTAVVSFVGASLPAFKVIETPLQAALFMLALGTSFSAFVIVILLIFRGIGKLKEHWLPVAAYLILAIGFWIALIFLVGTPSMDELHWKKNQNPQGVSNPGKMIDSDSTKIEIGN